MKVKNHKKNRRQLFFNGQPEGPRRRLPRRLANWRKVLFSKLTINGKPLGVTLGLMVLLAGLAPTHLWAGNLFKFTFTRTDASQWECLKANHGPEYATQTGTNVPAVGTNMPSYGGHTYRIDADNQVLVIDENHSVAITMPDPTWHLNPYHLGFAIDNSGVGWIISTESKDDNLDFLWTISINSGVVAYFDYVGPSAGTPFRPTGLVITQWP